MAKPGTGGGHLVALAEFIVHSTVFAYHAGQGQERPPVDELREELGLGPAVDRVDRIDDHGNRGAPVQAGRRPPP